MKIVKNSCYGGFALSEEAYNYFDLPWDGYGYDFNNHRDSPELVIDDYAGWETVREKHRTW